MLKILNSWLGKKGISSAAAAVIVATISITLVGTTYFFSKSFTETAMAETFEVIDIFQNRIIVRNTGTQPIESFRTLMEGKEVKNEIKDPPIQSQSVGTVIIDLTDISSGRHQLTLISRSMSQTWTWEFEVITTTVTTSTTTSTTTTPLLGEASIEAGIETEQGKAEIGKPVKWTSKISFNNPSSVDIEDYSVSIITPEDAVNIGIKDEEKQMVSKDKKSIPINLKEKETISYFIEYETPAPYKEETTITPFVSGEKYRKRIVVKSDFTGHYEDVRVFADIPEQLSQEEYSIRLYQTNGESSIDVTDLPQYNVSFIDSNFNNLPDKIEWVVPALSEQIFEVSGDPYPITFDRNLDCHKCGKHKAPPLTEVNMTITVTVSNPVDGANLTDYYPNEWTVIDANGGIVKSHNSTYNKIEWDVEIVNDSVSRWYIIKSPQRTTPSTKYYFQSELASQKSDLWMVIVADPPDIIPPKIEFIPPTPEHGKIQKENYAYVNISVEDANQTSSFIDWNRSLVGYWSFDSRNSTHVFDNSSYNNLGEMKNDVNCGVDGKYGEACKFDGVDDWISVSLTSSLNITGNQMTVEAWVKPLNNIGWQHIVDNYEGYWLDLLESGVFSFRLDSTTTEINADGTTPVIIGNWYHVVGVVDTDYALLYVNGNLDASRSFTGNINSSGIDTLSIGKWYYSYGYQFNGTIDEVRVWNIALNPEEINASYNSGLYRLYSNFTDLKDGTYEYYAYAIDAAGNSNQTETRYLTVDTVNPQIEFVPPTPDNEATQNEDYAYVNISVEDANQTSSFIDWNRSLVGYWAMDWYNSTGVYDNSTYGNDGTFNGGLGTDNITTGKFGYGLEFDGIDDYIEIPISESLRISDALTMEAWIKLPRNMSGDDWARGIVERRQRYRLLLLGNSTPYRLRFDIQDTDDEWCTAQKGCPETDRILNANQWYHTMAVFNGSYMMIYVNGELNVTEERLNSKIDISENFPVDIGVSDLSHFLNGSVDEVRIWNRALSPEEINASYNSGLYRLYHNFTDLQDGTYEYYAFATDTSGNWNKTETRILTVDTTPPQYFDNSTNNTVAGKPTLFSLRWTDNVGLGGYIFSFLNGSEDTTNTFGKTDIGANQVALNANDTYGSRFTLPEDGSVSKISIWMVTGTWHQKIKFAIYDVSGGNPNNLKGTSEEILSEVGWQWVNATFNPPIRLTGGDYYLFVWSTDDWYAFQYDTDGTHAYRNVGYNGFPDPFGTPDGTGNYNITIYATYTPWVNDMWVDFENSTGDAIFINSFEEGDFSAWTGDGASSGNSRAIVDTGQYHGKYRAEFQTVGDGWAGCWKDFDGVPTIYGRIYVKFSDSPLELATTASLLDFRQADNTNIGGVAYERTTGNVYRWILNNKITSEINVYVEEIEWDTWYYIEMKLIVHPTAGELRLYRNGTEILTMTSQNTGTVDCGRVHTGLAVYSAENPWTGNVSIDRAVISTNYIGSDKQGWSNVTKTLNSTIGALVKWQVYANDTFDNWNASEEFSLTTTSVDEEPPKWSNMSVYPLSGITYQSDQNYQFNVTWQDPNTSVDIVKIEHNFTGVMDNYTVTTYQDSEYYYDYSDLSAGTYVWREYANNTDGYENRTDQWIYIVNKVKPILVLNNGTASINTSGLVGYWRFQGNRLDSSGYDNDGSCSGGSCPSNTWGRFDGDSSAYSFDGVNDYVEVDGSESLNNLSQEITLEVWFKVFELDKYYEEYANPIFRKGSSLPADVNEDGVVDWTDLDTLSAGINWPTIGCPYRNAYSRLDVNEDNVVDGRDGMEIHTYHMGERKATWFLQIQKSNYWDTGVDKILFSLGGSRRVFSSKIFTSADEDKWFHVVGTYDGSTITLYINGVLDNSASASGSFISNNFTDNESFRIGAENPNGKNCLNYFNGIIDEPKIYNRSLTADEIHLLYESKVIYSIETEFSYSGCPTDQDVTCNFYRNTTPVSSPDIITLPTGYYYYLVKTSGGTNYTEMALLIPLNVTPPNQPPTIWNLKVRNENDVEINSTITGRTVIITVNAADPDDNIDYIEGNFTWPNGTIVYKNLTKSPPKKPYMYNWTYVIHPNMLAGNASINVTVYDRFGVSDSANTTLEILPTKELAIGNAPVNFSTVSPGQDVSATENQGWPLKVTVGGNIPLNISQMGEEYLTGATMPTIRIYIKNITWNQSETGIFSQLSPSFILVNESVDPGKDQLIYYRMYVPIIEPQQYGGNITIKGEETQT